MDKILWMVSRKKLRIINKTKGKWQGPNPHEKMVMKESTSIKHLKGDLLHYSFTSFQDYKGQDKLLC